MRHVPAVVLVVLVVLVVPVVATAAVVVAQSVPHQDTTQPELVEDECVLYSDGSTEVRLSAEDTEVLHELAESGSAQTQAGLGDMYFDGRCVPQDYERGFFWSRLAAEQGNAWAQTNLGEAYFHGRGVPKDYKLAFLWYQRAAERGNRWGQFLLAGAYLFGNGVPKDYVTGYMWLNLSAAQGYEDAGKIRDALARQEMTPEQIAEAQRLAREWLDSRP